VTALDRVAVIAAAIASYVLLGMLVCAVRQRFTWDGIRGRLDHQHARLRRRRAGTHLIEEMGHHPERIREMPDPVANEVYADIAEQLLDDGLADIVDETRWTQ
jgi:hypothetical protein